MSQAPISLPTTGILSGLALVNYVNDALARLSTLSSGNTDPATLTGGVAPYSLWMDTSSAPPALRIRNNTNTAWARIGTINGSNFIPDLSSVDITDALGFTPATMTQVNQQIGIAVGSLNTAINNEATARSNADNQKANKDGTNATGAWPISITGNSANGGVTSVNGQTGAVTVSPPTKLSQLQNDSGFLTSGGTIAGANYAANANYATTAGNGVAAFSQWIDGQDRGHTRITLSNGSYFEA